jgi:hypothetical protein
LGGAAKSTFRTDNGRVVSAGGGITPDVIIRAPERDPWVSFLDQRGVFTGFASQYVTLHRKVERTFEPDAQVLDEFRSYLGQQRLRVPEEYWAPDQDYLKIKIKAEVFNLVFGLATGEEVETRGDPQVKKAAGLFAQIPTLLKPPAARPTAARGRRTPLQQDPQR